MPDSLFDELSRDATVKCGGCGSLILAQVALRIEVHPLPAGPLDAPARVSCRQAACVRAVAQDVAAEWAI